MESFLPLVEYLLPDFIVAYYESTRVEQSSDLLHVDLEEKNYPESDPAKEFLLSKGFLPEITIQDFPIRDKRVFLHIKRRRWLNSTLDGGIKLPLTKAIFIQLIKIFTKPQLNKIGVKVRCTNRF